MLKDIIINDLEDGKVFFDLAGFGEMHNINGVDILCVLDKLDIKNINNLQKQNFFNIEKIDIILYMRSCEYIGKPIVNQKLRLDNINYKIINSFDNLGVLEIYLREILAKI